MQIFTKLTWFLIRSPKILDGMYAVGATSGINGGEGRTALGASSQTIAERNTLEYSLKICFVLSLWTLWQSD